jgi:hypothetical protein
MVILCYRRNYPNDVFIAFKNLDVKETPTQDSEVARTFTIPALEVNVRFLFSVVTPVSYE